MGNELLATYLELIAAKAKTLADEVRRGAHWPGDLNKGLSEIQSTLQKAQSLSRDDR